MGSGNPTGSVLSGEPNCSRGSRRGGRARRKRRRESGWREGRPTWGQVPPCLACRRRAGGWHGSPLLVSQPTKSPSPQCLFYLLGVTNICQSSRNCKFLLEESTLNFFILTHSKLITFWVRKHFLFSVLTLPTLHWSGRLLSLV